MSKNQSKGRSSSPHAGQWQLNPPPFTASAGPVLISSLDIARVTGKAHRHVMRDIKVTLKAANIDVPEFGHIFEDGYGRRQRGYLLPRFECDLVISGYSVPYRAAIIRRWYELENSARQSAPPAVAAWLVAKLMQIMPAERLMRLLSVRNSYGSIARNGKPRTGWRRPAYVAARHREEDARAFQEGMVQLNLTVQLELPKLAEAVTAMDGRRP